jgi:type I restriction enzyme R subunit
LDSNFSYLKKEKQYSSFVDACIEAESLMNVSYNASATYTRKAAELAVRWLYINDDALRLPYNDNFAALINSYDFRQIVGMDIYKAIDYTRELGNKATHTNMSVDRAQAVLSLRNLFNLTNFIDYCYSVEYEEREFNEDILGHNDKIKKTSEERERYKKLLDENQKNLEDLIKENQKLREENEKIRLSNESARNFNVDTLTEAETRDAYIKLDLEMKGWRFGSNCLEEVMVTHMKSSSKIGYVDYVLYGDDGKPLAVVEAKRTSLSPKQGKEQARLYADSLEIETGVRPIIFFTNGIDYYIWDDRDAPERKISGIYSKKDLESLFFIKKNRKSLLNAKINEDITNRYYQKEAIRRTLESYESGHRKALLVMATGSGKTRTAASIVDVMTKCNWAKNILFLADRTALVKQAKESFSKYLPDLSLCNLLESKDDVNSRMVFSTYPTIMNSIDEKKGDDGNKIFTTGHFDLIILDESHRSIYKKYKDIFDYFDAKLLGLTATPVSDIGRNTYRIFDLEVGNPTYAYDLDRAVEDGYLVPYELPAISETKIMKRGIIYNDLSEEEKEAFEETFGTFDDIPNSMINKSLFNIDTVDLVISDLMKRGIKVKGGDRLGKTIIFAANRSHADFIVERFNILYPEYKGEFAQAIYHSISYVDVLIDRFKNKNSFPQIAVSVDMLDTGIDVPEIVNLVFFKPVRSKAKFWQMVGRGTRLCENLFGPGMDKKKFYIFDYYDNFGYFGGTGSNTETTIQVSLTENIFNIKVDIIKILENMKYSDKSFRNYRNELVEDIVSTVNDINRDKFSASMRINYIDKFSNKETFESLKEKDIKELKDEVVPLIVSTDSDEMAKRFDYLMYTIVFCKLSGAIFTGEINRVKNTARSLMDKGTIPNVAKEKDLIYKLVDDEFWKDADIFDFENIRLRLRELIKLIDKEKREIYYTDFKDEVIGTKENEVTYTVNDLEAYKERVESYFKKYAYVLPIHKLRNNEKLTEEDVKYFEKVLFEELGDRTSFEKVYGEKPLLKLVAQIAGMDRKAAQREFSEFLSDERLNSDQIDFVKNIVEHIIKNGSLEKEIINDRPFNKYGNVEYLFDGKIDVAKNIISKIEKINDRLIV